jgi:hypothetical protein
MGVWLGVLIGLQGMIFGGLIASILAGVLDITKGPLEMTFFELLSIFTQCLIFVAGFWAVFAAIESAKNQKDQWLKEHFIKYESEVLIEFRKLIRDSRDAIHFWLNDFYKPRKYGFNLTEDQWPAIIRPDLVKFYNKICDVNNFYNENQYIFRKHELEDGVLSIILPVKNFRIFGEWDLKYVQVAKRALFEEFHLDKYADLKYMLASDIMHEFEHEKFNGLRTIEDLKKMTDHVHGLNQDQFTSLVDSLASRINKLEWRLDELTVHVDVSHDRMKIRRELFLYKVDN